MSDPIRAVCFDLDDTLYPYTRYARTGLAAAADYFEAETGRRYHAELLELYFEGDHTDDTFDMLVEQQNLPPRLVDGAVSAFHNSTTPLEPYAETPAILAALGEMYTLGVVTDGRGGHAKLDRLGLTNQFETVIVTPEMGLSKDDPAVFHRLFEELSVLPWSILYVGDDPRSDFRQPNAFGMKTVRIRRGRFTDIEPEADCEPDAEIERLDELPAVINELESTPRTVEGEQ